MFLAVRWPVADADGAGQTITVECIQGLRRPGEGALCVLGYAPVTEAARVRPLIGGRLGILHRRTGCQGS